MNRALLDLASENGIIANLLSDIMVHFTNLDVVEEWRK